MTQKSALFTPGVIGARTIKNRLVVAPMCQYRAQEGFVQTWHKVHYGKLAGSGAGTVCIEATAVSARGRSTPFDLGLWDREHARSMAELVSIMRQIDPTVCIKIQLFDAGRKASCSHREKRTLLADEGGWPIYAPSAKSYGEGLARPEPMTIEQIQDSIAAFAQAAAFAEQAGVDAIELHASHGFLVHQFFSSLSNERTDAWGGSLENRCRFACEVFRAMKKAAPSVIMGARISAEDWVKGGSGLQEAQYLGLALKRLGADYLDVTSGGLVSEQRIPVRYGYQLPASRALRQACALPTLTAGLIVRPEQAESALVQGDADFINVGRAFLMDPHWGWRAALLLGETLEWPEPYRRGMRL